MRYYGGKKRLSKKIAEVLTHYDTTKPYLEPFLGSASWTGRLIANDINSDVITYFKNIQQGFSIQDLPELTKESLINIKQRYSSGDRTPEVIAYLCIYTMGRCSGNSLKMTGGSTDRPYMRTALKYENQIREALSRTTLLNIDYRELNPKGYVIYCDPPYAGTTGNSSLKSLWTDFSTDEFWELMRKWSEDNDVIVSEMIAPSDFKQIASFVKTVTYAWPSCKASNNGQAIVKRYNECLYVKA